MQYFFTTFMLRAKDTPQFGFWSTGASFRWCCGGLSSEVHDRLLVDGGLLDGVIPARRTCSTLRHVKRERSI
jgi:hypothetical protein